MSESLYQLIKRSIAEDISAGRWAEGEALPSENELCRIFGVARMTVNRAMRELAAERIVRRVPGLGTFVADPEPYSDLVEIRSIAEEVAARGHRYRADICALERAWRPEVEEFDLLPETALLHSAIVHYENDTPIQFEDRLVNPVLVPDYLQQDFTQITPNAYLMRVAPLQEAEHEVSAIAAPGAIAARLQIEAGEPCLLVHRRTWSGGQLATVTALYHPGHLFRLRSRFTPSSNTRTIHER